MFADFEIDNKIEGGKIVLSRMRKKITTLLFVL
jgi:hypothetical protein